jgi:hypothetical protein
MVRLPCIVNGDLEWVPRGPGRLHLFLAWPGLFVFYGFLVLSRRAKSVRNVRLGFGPRAVPRRPGRTQRNAPSSQARPDRGDGPATTRECARTLHAIDVSGVDERAAGFEESVSIRWASLAGVLLPISIAPRQSRLTVKAPRVVVCIDLGK